MSNRVGILLKTIILSALVAMAIGGCSFIGIDQPKPTNQSGGGLINAVAISGAGAVIAGSCNNYTVQTVSSGVASGMGLADSGNTFNLSAAGNSQTFADASCTTALTVVPLSASGAGSFYMKDTLKENITLNGSLAGAAVAASGSKAVSVLGAAPKALGLTATSVNATLVCVGVNLKIVDDFGNSTSTHAGFNVGVTLSGIPSANVYNDANCQTPVGNVPVGAGVAEKLFYVQSPVVGTLNVNVATAGLISANTNLDFVAGSTPKIVVVGPTGNLVASSCNPMRVESRRADGSSLYVAGLPIDVAISALTGTAIQFFSDANCLAVLPGSLAQIPVGEFTGNFYVKTTSAPQSSNIGGSAPGYISGSTILNWIPIPPAAVSITGIPASVPAGSCVLASVNLIDGNGNPAFVSANTAVSLSAGIGAANPTQAEFFSNNTCTGAVITSTTIAQCSGIGACVNNVNVYVRPKLVGQASLIASSPNLVPGTAFFDSVIPTGTAISLALARQTNPTKAGACIDYAVATKDQFGNLINVSAALNLALASVSASNLGTFWADSACSISTASVTIPANQHVAHFYLRDVKAENAIINTTGPGALFAQDSITLIADTATKLTFVGVPASLPATQCSGNITVRESDQFDNITNVPVAFNLLASNGVKFYSDSNCVNVITAGAILAGFGESTGFFFSGPSTGNATLNAIATTSGFTQNAVQAVLLTTAPAIKLALSCDANNLLNNNCGTKTVLQCIPVYAATFDNANNLFSPIGVTLTASLTSNSGNAGIFFSDNACTTLLPGNSLTLSSNPKAFFVKNTVAQSFSIAGTPSVGSAGNATITTVAGPANKLVIDANVGPAIFLSETCVGPYNVRVQDQFGNAALVASNTAISFQGSTINGAPTINPLTTFFADSSCSNAAIAIPAGSEVTQFYINSAQAGALKAFATASNLNFAFRDFSVTARAKISFFANGIEITGINFGSVPRTQSSATQPVLVKNVSTGDTASLSSFTMPGVPFTITSSATNGCPLAAPFQLAAGTSCSVDIKFEPVLAGAVSANLIANYTSVSDPTSARTSSLALQGNGVAIPFVGLVLSPASLTFNNVPAGTTQTFTGYLQNLNAYAVSVTGLNAPTAPFTIVPQAPCSATFPFSLAANTSCNVDIKFSPTAAGTFSSSFAFKYTNPNTGATDTTASTPLTGYAIAPTTQLSVNPILQNFGDQNVGTTSANVPIVVTNNGSFTATALTLNASFANFNVSMGTCGASLAAGASCTLQANFAPTATGFVSVSPTLNYITQNGTVNQSVGFTLQGTGVQSTLVAPFLSLASINFGSVIVGNNSTVSMTLTNPNNAAITINAFNAPTAPFDVTAAAPCSNTVPFTLAASTSCTLTVKFSPTTAAHFASQFSYGSNAGTSNVTQVQGDGVSNTNPLAVLTITPNSWDFGSVTVGQTSAIKTFTIANVGNQAADSIVLSNITSPFNMSIGTCGGILAVGASCTVTASFSPNLIGNYTDAIRLSFRSLIANVVTSTPGALNLAGAGTSQTGNANLIFDVGQINFGNVPIGAWIARYVRVTNNGTVAATNVTLSGNAINNPYGFNVYYNTCGSIIPAGTSCLLDTYFAPNSYGSRSASFKLNYKSNGTDKSTAGDVTLTGFGYWW